MILIGTLLMAFTCLLLAILFPNFKTINSYIGYRTVRSMKSQANWTFAQKYFSTFMLWAGIASLVCALIVYFFSEYIPLAEGVYFFCFTLYMGYGIYKTEKALKQFEANNTL